MTLQQNTCSAELFDEKDSVVAQTKMKLVDVWGTVQ
jgi:hypothetical protein